MRFSKLSRLSKLSKLPKIGAVLTVVFALAFATVYDVRFIVPPPKDRVAILWMLRKAHDTMSTAVGMGIGSTVITNITAYSGGGHLEVYHLSNVSYRHLTSRITYHANEPYIIKQMITPWRPKAKRLGLGLGLREPVCPDNSTEFVSATACPQYPSAIDYTVSNYLLANSLGYSSQILVGPDATRQNYLDYLVCPNLGGFSNIGHGDQNEIFLYDGPLTSDDLATLDLQNRTTVIFNSCNVMNIPMSSVMNDNGARFYAGGVSELLIGSSEPVTYCFWTSTLQGHSMTSAMTRCAQMDPNDVWGFEDPSGQQIFQP